MGPGSDGDGALDHDDFVIHIGPDDGQGYRVFARAESAGEAYGHLRWHTDLEGWAESADAWRPIPQRGQSLRRSLEEIGARLHEALFQGEILELYTKSRTLAEGRGRSLRLRLELPPGHPELLRIFSLPWELLRTERDGFWLLGRGVRLLRHPTLMQPLDGRPRLRQLRVLVILAQPDDQPKLDAEKEWQALEAVWQDHPTVHTTRLRDPAVERVLERLDEEEIHVLHFIGHGGFDPRFEHWALCFRAAHGATRYVSAGELAEGLRGTRSSLRLVVLNACQSARVADPRLQTPTALAGVAMSLVLAGVNAVVATQAIITDRAAIELTKGLYHRLSAGDAIDAALATARRRIARLEWTKAVLPAEWAVPVLFLRGDGKLFEVAASRVPPEEPRRWSPSPLGLMSLVSGAVGVAGLASLGALWIPGAPAFRWAMAIFVAILASLSFGARKLWAAHERKDLVLDLSRFIASRRGVVGVLLALPGIALLAWWLLGTHRIYALECPHVPPECLRETCVAVLPITAVSPEDQDASEKTRRRLASLSLDGLHFIAVDRRGRVPSGCFAAVLEGAHLRGEEGSYAFQLGGRALELVSARLDSEPDEEILRVRAIQAVVEAIDGPLTEAHRAAIGALSSQDRRALELAQRGDEAMARGDGYEARRKFRRAAERDPRFADAHNNLGLARLMSEEPDVDGALAAMRAALALRPEDPFYLYNLGLALEQRASMIAAPGSSAHREALYEAAEAYGAARRRQPFWPALLNNLGFLWLRLGELERAERDLNLGRDEATEPPHLASLEKNLGRLALAKQDPRSAIEHLRRSLEVKPSPAAWYHLARARILDGDTAGSCTALRSYADALASGQRDREPDHAGRLREVITRLADCPAIAGD